MVLACLFCGEGVQQRNNGLRQHFYLGEMVPLILTLMPDSLVPPHTSWMPLEILLQHWSSEGVSQVSLCMIPLRETTCHSSSLYLTQPQSLLVLKARSHWDFSSWYWNPRIGGLVCGWEPSILKESFVAKIPLLIFIYHTWVWDQPVLFSAPPASLGVASFLYFQLCDFHLTKFQVVLNDDFPVV